MTIEQVLIGDGIKFNNRKRILNYFKKRNQSLDADVQIDMIPKIRELEQELKKNQEIISVAQIKREYQLTKLQIENNITSGRLKTNLFGEILIESFLVSYYEDSKLVPLEHVLQNYEKDYDVLVGKKIYDYILNVLIQTNGFGTGIFEGSQLLRKVEKGKKYYLSPNISLKKINETLLKQITELINTDNYQYLWREMEKYPYLFHEIQVYFSARPYEQNTDKQPVLHFVMLVSLSLKSDITEWTNGDVEKAKKKIKSNHIKNRFKSFLRYYYNAHIRDCNYNPDLLYISKESKKREETPYNIKDFLRLGNWLFSEENMLQGGLLDRVLASKSCANLALYNCLFFFCAWRKPDVFSIELPRFSNLDELYKLIQEKDLEDPRFLDVYEEFSLIVEGKYASKNRVELRLVKSEPIRKGFGIYLIINKWNQITARDATVFIDEKSFASFKVYKELYGEDYVRFFGTKPLLHKKMNKTFLLYQASNAYKKNYNVQLRELPELVGAYIRGHRIDLDSGPNTILHYIGDASGGMTSNEVLREMYARGSMGHYKDLLCEIIIPGFYRLEFKEKTEIISAIEIKPMEMEVQIENLMKITSNINSAIKDNLLSNVEDMAKCLAYNWISGNNYAKEKHVKCIYQALTGHPNPACKGQDYCMNPEKGCLCRYGIFERLYVYELIFRKNFFIKKAKKCEQKLNEIKGHHEKEYSALLHELSYNQDCAIAVDDLLIELLSGLDDSRTIKRDLINLYEKECGIFDLSADYSGLIGPSIFDN